MGDLRESELKQSTQSEADLKENLESCCRAVWLAESRRSSAEMFCRASSLDESWTPSSPQTSAR